MDMLDKAKDLGLTIRDSKEMSDLKSAEAALLSDEKGQRLMDEYKDLQIKLVKATKEKRSQEEIEELKQGLMDKQEEINKYDVTKIFLDAKNNFDQLMKKINEILLFTITGEEPCTKGNCSSCNSKCN